MILILRFNDWVIQFFSYFYSAKVVKIFIYLALQDNHAMFIWRAASVFNFLKKVTIPKYCCVQILMYHSVCMCVSAATYPWHLGDQIWHPCSDPQITFSPCLIPSQKSKMVLFTYLRDFSLLLCSFTMILMRVFESLLQHCHIQLIMQLRTSAQWNLVFISQPTWRPARIV